MAHDIVELVKKVTELPRVGLLDAFIGFVLTSIIVDRFIQPHFESGEKNYSQKLASFAVVTVIFLVIAAGIILLSMWTRMAYLSRHKKK